MLDKFATALFICRAASDQLYGCVASRKTNNHFYLVFCGSKSTCWVSTLNSLFLEASCTIRAGSVSSINRIKG